MKQMTTHAGKDKRKWNTCSLQIYTATFKVSLMVPREKDLCQNQAIPLLGIYSKDTPSYYRDICSSRFIAMVFTVARTWKQLKCPSTDDWIMKM